MLCVVVGLKMAAKSASNSFLFTNEDGSPMVFVITPGDTKTRLRPIVEVRVVFVKKSSVFLMLFVWLKVSLHLCIHCAETDRASAF